MITPTLTQANRRKSIENYLIFLAILVLGGLAYFIILHFCFTAGQEVQVEMKDNNPLSDYATTIAGLLGTAITLTGVAFLIYAFKDQQRQAESELFNKLYDDLLEDINSIQYRKHYKKILLSPDDSELLQGVDAIFNYQPDDGNNPNSVLNHLNLIVLSFDNILNLINASNRQDAYYKKVMLYKVYLLFYSKIHWPCKHGIYERYGARLLRGGWGNASMLFYKYEVLTKQAYTFLYNEGFLFLTKKDKYLTDTKLEECIKHPDAEYILGETLYKILHKKHSDVVDRVTLKQFWATDMPCVPSLEENPSDSELEAWINENIKPKSPTLAAELIYLADRSLPIKARRFRALLNVIWGEWKKNSSNMPT
ncbi:MAG: hypothetical protein EOO61_09400 [Hymenobacter sp.]|nr:MAG: hypothetical protein EOO61_09400 [Hymenobacter sp.]